MTFTLETDGLSHYRVAASDGARFPLSDIVDGWPELWQSDREAVLAACGALQHAVRVEDAINWLSDATKSSGVGPVATTSPAGVAKVGHPAKAENVGSNPTHLPPADEPPPATSPADRP